MAGSLGEPDRYLTQHYHILYNRALAHDVTELTKSVCIRILLVKLLKTCGKKVLRYTGISEMHNSWKLFFWYVSIYCWGSWCCTVHNNTADPHPLVRAVHVCAHILRIKKKIFLLQFNVHSALCYCRSHKVELDKEVAVGEEVDMKPIFTSFSN